MDGLEAGPRPSGAPEGCSVFVANLQWWTTDAELESLCSQYGTVTGVRFIEDRACGKSRGMAVVDFTTPQAVQACIDGMNGQDINGRPCRVNKQIPRPVHAPGTGGVVPSSAGAMMGGPPRGPPGMMGRGRGRGMPGGPGRGMIGMDGSDGSMTMGAGMVDPGMMSMGQGGMMMGGGPRMMMGPMQGMMMGGGPPGMMQYRPPPPPG